MSDRKHSMLAGMKDVAPTLAGVVPFGMVAGAAVVQAGLGTAEAMGMSLFVHAGASAIIATALFREGAPVVIALLTALVVNTRMLIYSASLAPKLSKASPRSRPLLGHLLTDQSYVLTMTRGDRPGIDPLFYYIGTVAPVAIIWQLSNLAGALLGPLVPVSWNLDFTVPLLFLALLAPTLKDSSAVNVALVTAAAAAVLVPLLPLQLGIVTSILAGMVFGAWRDGLARPALAEEAE